MVCPQCNGNSAYYTTTIAHWSFSLKKEVYFVVIQSTLPVSQGQTGIVYDLKAPQGKCAIA